VGGEAVLIVLGELAILTRRLGISSQSLGVLASWRNTSILGGIAFDHVVFKMVVS
jgi:hypothetical protein